MRQVALQFGVLKVSDRLRGRNMSETWQLHNLITSLEKSGLLDNSQLDRAYQLARSPLATVNRLLSTLVRWRWLTAFQARQLRRGRWKGFRLGRYRIMRPLSSGGVGIVFLATDTFSDREVAIKVLRSQHRGKVRFCDRLRLEALALSLLQHQNIVRAADPSLGYYTREPEIRNSDLRAGGSLRDCQPYRRNNHSPLNETIRNQSQLSVAKSAPECLGDLNSQRCTYLAMELVKGPTLRELLVASRILPWWQACDFISQAAEGLRYAHHHGFIHRDIKPDNLIVAPDGTVKLLDFGFAKYVGDLKEFETPPGHRVGTAGYIAPELLLGQQEASESTDLYSLGCTFYIALTGKHPFPGRTREDRVASQLDGRFRSVRYLNPDVPVPIVDLVEKMICKSPGNRIRAIDQVLERLQPFAKQDSFDLGFCELLRMRDKARRGRTLKHRNVEQQRFMSDVARHLSFEDSGD